MTDKSNITVAFHIGRNPRNFNAGFVTYEPNVTSLRQAMDDCMVEDADENGNALPDKEWRLLDSGGNVVLEGREAIESETGVLDYDGEYDTWIVKTLDECNKREDNALYRAYKNYGIPSWVDNADDIKDYAVEQQGLHRIHEIRFYPSNWEVFTSDGCLSYSFEPTAYDDEDEAYEGWNSWCDMNDIDAVSIETFEDDVKIHTSNCEY